MTKRLYFPTVTRPVNRINGTADHLPPFISSTYVRMITTKCDTSHMEISNETKISKFYAAYIRQTVNDE